MNLKEAFRFQNKLQGFLFEIQNFLQDDSNVTKVETTFLRKKVMPEAENETVLTEPASVFSGQVNGMMDYCMYLLEQKELLSRAIRVAKAALPIDMDSEVSLNSCRQNAAAAFSKLVGLRASESTVPGGGTGYRFNAEGNQVSYRCDIRKVTTINFDRGLARRYMVALHSRADEVSVELDRALVNSTVEYTPPFDVNDTFADAFEAFLESRA